MKVSLNWLVSAEMFLIGQRSPGQVLPGQILLQQLKFVKGSPRNLCLKFGQIGSVTAEIFPIWTNVNWTNVNWTNVTVTVGMC